jgi:predicted protein tyrosine phosphatase
MTIIVCPLRHVAQVIEARAPSHVVTLLGPETADPPCAGIPAAQRLILKFHDITAPMPGYHPPVRATVEAVLAFGATWEAAAPLLIHCFAGISRSTAAAYILACEYAGPGFEAALASQLRGASPTATPNSLMIALADDILGRNGRMIAAIQDIGRGADAFEGTPFDLEIKRPRAP